MFRYKKFEVNAASVADSFDVSAFLKNDVGTRLAPSYKLAPDAELEIGK